MEACGGVVVGCGGVGVCVRERHRECVCGSDDYHRSDACAGSACVCLQRSVVCFHPSMEPDGLN